MSRKAKTNGSTALATVATGSPALQITRVEANSRMKARALELYHAARAQREEHILAFETEYGRADRIDHTVLADLQRIQARLAAIAARQQRGTGGEPKVLKFVEQIGTMVGAVSAYVATQRALELFAPVQQADYVGWNGSGVGPKGQDDALLAGYEIVDDPLGAKNAAPTADEDGEVYLHSAVEPYEDEPKRGACLDCGVVRLARHAGGRIRRWRSEFVRSASMLAMWRAVRDAHRTVCDRDAMECDACRQYGKRLLKAVLLTRTSLAMMG